MNRHRTCYSARKLLRNCPQCLSLPDDDYEPHSRLEIALSTCCRQIHQDTSSLIFSVNTWSFTDPWRLNFFHLDFPHVESFCIRRMHLDIIVRYDWEEENWKNLFHTISQDFKSLQYLYIDIEQRPDENHYLKQWHFKTAPECTFLKDLQKLRNRISGTEG